ncbi:MAG: protein kinase [Streptosporangiales bacterium]|nr:protein kinase [Streptosporangiales bacterium]
MRAGQLIAGRYRLDERVGSGGMGVVWSATDQKLGRVVAIKRGWVAGGDEGSTRRAEREARIAARLHHPHVITLHDVESDDDDTRWLVMEYFPSRSLADILGHRGTLPERDVARLGAQIAGALEAVHAQGVVHRDVKPGNVLVGDDGVAKLTDFGIARPAWGDVTLTSSGGFGGTPAYFAPEVARGAEPTEASDVFSLGATLFTAVEGAPPFGEPDNPAAMLGRAAAGEVTPTRRSHGLVPVLTALLATDPARRPTAAAARSLLRELVGTGDDTWDIPVVPLRRRSRRRAVTTVAAAAVALAVTVSAVALLAGDRRPGRTAAGAGTPAASTGAVIDDPHTADPCGLIQAETYERFGDAELNRTYGNFDRCDVVVEPSGDQEIDVAVELAPPDPADIPAGTTEKVGALRVVREPEGEGTCDRTVLLADDHRVDLTAKQYDGRSTKLCTMADIATEHAVDVLSRGTFPQRPAPPPESLAGLDACRLLDDEALARIPGVDANDPRVGFGNWGCSWESTTNDLTVDLLFDRDMPLSAADDGHPMRVSGRKAYVEPKGDGDETCLAQTEYRTFSEHDWRKAELLYLVVRGDGPTSRLCDIASDLTKDAAAELPPPR